jgi:competence ComEA-like helix-hairpin-helix protein
MDWQRHYYRLQQRLALTRRETHALALVILFLAAGLAIRHVRYHLVPYDPSYYAEIDRLAGTPPARADSSARALLSPPTDSTRPDAVEPPHRRPADGRTLPDLLVNINTATASDLEKLPRIGPKTAERIVSFRETNGPFRRAEDLMLIRGIGEKTFEGLRAYVVVD